MSDAIRGAGTILVVDDLQGNLELLKGLLTREGYAVHTAADGEAALAAVAREAPDVVLLDVTMPKLDGFEVCRRSRSLGHAGLRPGLRGR